MTKSNALKIHSNHCISKLQDKKTIYFAPPIFDSAWFTKIDTCLAYLILNSMLEAQ